MLENNASTRASIRLCVGLIADQIIYKSESAFEKTMKKD